MSEHPEAPEHEPNRSPEQLTFAEAGERLNISADAVRMRVNRGKLATARVNDRTFVLWPQPAEAEQSHEPRTERTGSPNRSGVQDDALTTQLRGEVAFLRSELETRTEEIRRRDVIINNLVDQVRALPATVDVVGVPQERNSASPRGDVVADPWQALPTAPAPQESGLRRWWRRWVRGD